MFILVNQVLNHVNKETRETVLNTAFIQEIQPLYDGATIFLPDGRVDITMNFKTLCKILNVKSEVNHD